MKKYLIIILSFGLFITGCGKEKKVLEINQIEVKNDLIYEKKSIRPFIGKVISKYDNGSLFSEYNYINGRLNGFFKEYYENGQLEREENYKNGNRDGLLKEYSETGELKAEKHFKPIKLIDDEKMF